MVSGRHFTCGSPHPFRMLTSMSIWGVQDCGHSHTCFLPRFLPMLNGGVAPIEHVKVVQCFAHPQYELPSMFLVHTAVAWILQKSLDRTAT